jgi:hypothetical protein
VGDIIIFIKLKCFYKILSNNSMGYLNFFGYLGFNSYASWGYILPLLPSIDYTKYLVGFPQLS